MQAFKTCDANEITILPSNFTHGPFDCICARGKHALNHEGNLRYRELIRENLLKYSNSKSKFEKSIIVSSIVDSVRDRSPTGGFVKEVKGQWYQVGDHMAREKVGQNIRDLLHGQYKSSTKAKQCRRKVDQSNMDNEYGHLVKSSVAISKKMKQISGQSFRGSALSMTEMLNAANIDLLKVIKSAYPTAESLEDMGTILPAQ